MARITIPRNVAEKARSRSNLSTEERRLVDELLGRGTDKQTVTAEVAEIPVAYLKSLLEDTRLTANQRAVIAMRIHGMKRKALDVSDVYETLVATPVELGSVLVGAGKHGPNCEVFRNGRWYPVTLQVEFMKGEDSTSRAVFLRGTLSICEVNQPLYYYVAPQLFLDDRGQSSERTVLNVLQEFGLRRLQTSASDYNLKLLDAERTAADNGRQVLIAGPVLCVSDFFWQTRLESRTLGTEEMPSRGIIDAELEVEEDHRTYYSPYAQTEEGISRLPFVRVFSLDLKTYVYVDVEDIREYDYDQSAMSKLHLPERLIDVLGRVFHTPVEAVFGDLIDGKHGGVVVLACGGPGVGKTLTAEVYAETTRRPLYTLELGELGTTASSLEENLRRVFSRVARWNAVLQFDECEIFLAERGNDLERSAIVGIFLRLLDYYRGILFLTTNRADVLDRAVLSRVMLKLDYPDLDNEAREAIWRTMFISAGMRLEGDDYTALAECNINGRQIRNLTRLAKILYPDGKVTLEQMREVLSYNASGSDLGPAAKSGKASTSNGRSRGSAGKVRRVDD